MMVIVTMKASMNNMKSRFFYAAVMSAFVANALVVACEQRERTSYEPRDYLKVLRCCEEELRKATPQSPLFKSMSLWAGILQSHALRAQYGGCSRNIFMDEIKRYSDTLEEIGLCRDIVQHQRGSVYALELYRQLHKVNICTQGGVQQFDVTVKKMENLILSAQEGNSHN